MSSVVNSLDSEVEAAQAPPALAGVLLLAYYYPPVNVSGAQRPSRFVRHLSHFGFDPHVVACGENASSERLDHAAYVPSRETAAAEPAARRAALHERLLLPYDQKRPWIPHSVFAAERIIREHDIRCIVSTSPPVATHYAALELKRRTGLPWIADFRDPYVGNPMRTSLRCRLFDSWGERTVLRGADAVIANTDTLGEAMRKRYPNRADDIIVLMNGYDPEEPIAPRPIPTGRTQKVLAHIGALYAGRKPDVIVDSLSRLIRSGNLDPSGVKLDFIGPYDPSLAIGTGTSGELMNMGVMECPGTKLPREDANRRMAEADWLLLLDLNHIGATLQIPAKVFDYVRVERPILAFSGSGSPTERLLGQTGLRHECLDPELPSDEIDRRVLAFLNSPAPAGELSPEFRHKFEARQQVAELARLIRRLMG